MAEVLPINFPLPSESAVASYDYYDFADGTGMKLLYFAATSDDEILTANSVYSNTIETSYLKDPMNDTSYTKYIDKDFDLSAFTTPKTIGGTAYFNGTFYFDSGNTGAGQTMSAYIQIMVRKWDGSSETEIANNTYTLSHGSGNSTEKKLFCMSVTIPNTNFKIGETLRISVLVYGKLTAVDSGLEDLTVAFGYDPMNRDGTYIIPSADDPVTTTQLKGWIPFKIDL